MRIREIVFQGVWNCDSPVRLAAAPGVDRMSLPTGLQTADIHALILALFYPDCILPRLAEQLSGQQVKLAAIFGDERREYRLLRRSKPSSLRLQVKRDGRFHSLAKGQQATTEALAEKLGLPDFESFVVLNLWRFDDGEIFALQDGLAGLDDSGRRLIEQYRTAVEVESLEDRIKTIEGQIVEQKNALGEGARVEEKLDQARARLEELRLDELSEEDLALLGDKDERLGKFDQQLERLMRQEQDECSDLEGQLPERPWKRPLLWAGLCIGLAAVAASIAFHSSLRQIAAVNVVGLGLVAWVMLKYFTDLERASVHQVRLESIKRRLNQVREEKVAYHEKINHLLIHAGVDQESELFERIDKTKKLEAIVTRLEDKVAQMHRKPAHQAASRKIDGLEASIAELERKRGRLPDVIMSVFQLERDLRSIGVDPSEALAAGPQGARAGYAAETTFVRLKAVAERTGQWTGTGLKPKTRKMWAKICAHVLSKRFKGVDLSTDGELRVRDFSAEQLEMWRRTRSSEERILTAALALALQVNISDHSVGHFQTIWINDPRDEFGSSVADAFGDVFASAAKKSHIILCSA